MRKAVFCLAASMFLLAAVAQAQDAPSLGDVARQARLQKQQKDSPAKPATKLSAGADPQNSLNANNSASPKAAHVISNEDLPEHTAAATPEEPGNRSKTPDGSPSSSNRDARAEQVKSEIQSQKDSIASLKQQIDNLNSSIHFAGGNCVANCAQWNERQKQKQDEVESMKVQLEAQQKHLEEMQEAARKQGFGSSVYEP